MIIYSTKSADGYQPLYFILFPYFDNTLLWGNIQPLLFLTDLVLVQTEFELKTEAEQENSCKWCLAMNWEH